MTLSLFRICFCGFRPQTVNMDYNIAPFNLSKTTVTSLKNMCLQYINDTDLCLSKENSYPNISSSTKKLSDKTALELYQDEILSGCILSYNEKLDLVLKDVIIPQTITEFAGDSGSGKTQVCFQLCISVQLPEWCGGYGGEAVYINTNNNFSSGRLRELIGNFIEQYNTLETKAKPINDTFCEDFILKHIHCIKIKDSSELIACIELLTTYLKEKKIKLIVIDSISYPIRLLDATVRKTICRFFRDLRNLAGLFNFAVVFTNDLTTRVNEGESYVTPSFGDSFYHLVNSRIIFSKKNTVFHAKLLKSNHIKKESLFFI